MRRRRSLIDLEAYTVPASPAEPPRPLSTRRISVAGAWTLDVALRGNIFEADPADRAFFEELAALLDRHTDRIVNRDNPAAADE